MPGTGLVTVFNRTLAKLGGTLVSDPAENSPQARVLSALCASVARTELRKHAFSCALTRASLPAVSAAPAFGYAYAYNVPSDFLRAFMVLGLFDDQTLYDVGGAPKPAYVIEGAQILTDNGSPLQIRYVKDISTHSELWDDALVDVVACALGVEASPILTKSEKTTGRLAAQYKQAIYEAKRVNAIELPPQGRPDASWMLTRAY